MISEGEVVLRDACLQCLKYAYSEEEIRKFIAIMEQGTKKSKNWYKPHREMLLGRTDKWDLALTYKFMLHNGTKIDFNSTDLNSLGFFLTTATEIRNSLNHPASNVHSPTSEIKFINIVHAARSILKLAGSQFASEKVAAAQIAQEQRIKEIENIINHDNKKLMNVIGKTVLADGKSKRKELWESNNNSLEFLPIGAANIQRSEVFYENIKFTSEHSMWESKSTIVFNDILDLVYARKCCFSILKIIGASGCGKSFIIRKIMDEFYDPKSKYFVYPIYDLVFYINCKDNKFETTQEYIAVNMPGSFVNYYNNKHIIEAITDLKCLFLIDDRDKLSENSRLLLIDVMAHFKLSNSTFVMTSTTDEYKTFCYEQSFKKSNSITVIIASISDISNQLLFLQNYEKVLDGGASLIDSFRNQINFLNIDFSTAFDLVLFVRVNFEKKFHDEIFFFQLCYEFDFRQILNFSHKFPEIEDSVYFANSYLGIICQLCLLSIHNDTYEIDQKTLKQIENVSCILYVCSKSKIHLTSLLAELRAIQDYGDRQWKNLRKYQEYLASIPVMEQIVEQFEQKEHNTLLQVFQLIISKVEPLATVVPDDFTK